MEHLTVRANNAAFHIAKIGSGRPLLLLHGWPEFWLSWEPVMARLADRFTLYAPDLRGFGDSDKPDGPHGPDQHAQDMLALMDGLGLLPGCEPCRHDTARAPCWGVLTAYGAGGSPQHRSHRPQRIAVGQSQTQGLTFFSTHMSIGSRSHGNTVAHPGLKCCTWS